MSLQQRQELLEDMVFIFQEHIVLDLIKGLVHHLLERQEYSDAIVGGREQTTTNFAFGKSVFCEICRIFLFLLS